LKDNDKLDLKRMASPVTGDRPSTLNIDWEECDVERRSARRPGVDVETPHGALAQAPRRRPSLTSIDSNKFFDSRPAPRLGNPRRLAVDISLER
jgi:hypothetical protein